MARWNSKLISVDRVKSGPVVCGERYEALYQMGGKQAVIHVEVADALAAEKVVLRHTKDGQNGYVLETFTLTPERDGTRVTQILDFSRSGIPVPIRLLMSFIHTYGWTVGEPIL